MSKPAIFGIVENESQAQIAVSNLENAGFMASDISVLGRNADNTMVDETSTYMAQPGMEMAQPGTGMTPSAIDMTQPATDMTQPAAYAAQPATGSGTREVGHVNATKAPEGTTAGVLSGGAIGAIAGWMIGIGALAIPGVGPFIAAGPILAALSGAAIGATAGGVTGALIGYGIPEYEAKLYSGRLEKGHVLIGVHAVTSEEATAAKEALKAAGATDIHVTSEMAAK